MIKANGNAIDNNPGGIAAGNNQGGIITAWLTPHPPVVVPDVGHGREREISATLEAMRSAAEDIVDGGPELIIISSPHAPTRGSTILVSGDSMLKGDLRQFGARNTAMEFEGDREVSELICREAEHAKIDARFYSVKERGGLDHGAVVPLYFINEAVKKRHASPPRLVVMSIAFLDNAGLFRFGGCVARAVRKSGRSAALIASGDLSHKLKDDGPYGFDPAGPAFDKFLLGCVAAHDVAKLMETDEHTLERAAQCGFYGLLTLYGAIGPSVREAKILSYEGTFGVGYAIAKIY